jgi:beta-phosphoglucomutase-like phosphatase (HAD superfamily)
MIDHAAVRVLLCDADGTLFPSEEPAFEASVKVTNRLMEELGSDRRFTAPALRRQTNGTNFRNTAPRLARAEGIELAPGVLEHWVREERREVTAHLERALRPDPRVSGPLRRLADRYRLAVVTSSAAARVAACLRVTELADCFPAGHLFSAEDSVIPPRSKPSPAVYLHAREELGITRGEGLAIEDSVPGVQSAVRAGLPVVGCVMFVAHDERAERIGELREAGACAIVSSWEQLEAALPASAAVASA